MVKRKRRERSIDILHILPFVRMSFVSARVFIDSSAKAMMMTSKKPETPLLCKAESNVCKAKEKQKRDKTPSLIQSTSKNE